jgi:hypothetical protein
MFNAFHAPRTIYGPNAFREFVYQLGGPKSVSKYLEVTERTVWRWLSEGNAPRAAVLALYWETQYGRAQIFTEQVNEIRALYGRVRLLQDQYTRAKDIVAGLRKLHTGGANEPIFEEMAAGIEMPHEAYGVDALSTTEIAVQADAAVLPAATSEIAERAEAIRQVIEQARAMLAKTDRQRKKRAA